MARTHATADFARAPKTIEDSYRLSRWTRCRAHKRATQRSSFPFSETNYWCHLGTHMPRVAVLSKVVLEARSACWKFVHRWLPTCSSVPMQRQQHATGRGRAPDIRKATQRAQYHGQTRRPVATTQVLSTQHEAALANTGDGFRMLCDDSAMLQPDM